MELLSVKGLNLKIGPEQKIINGSFAISPGEVTLLTGPNGCGKSTFIKVIMNAALDYKDLDISYSEALFNGELKILDSVKENEIFRRSVCYVSQEDEFESESVLDCFENSIGFSVSKQRTQYVFDFVKRFRIYDCFNISATSTSLKRKERKIAQRIGLPIEKIADEDRMAISFLLMSIKNMSGGQKKLTNIFSILIRYSFSKLIILDEPLNNLDYSNVRAFSNVLTQIYKAKPDLSILIVTHCRSIPIINKVISIDPGKKQFVEEDHYSCNSCFGQVNDEGFYV